MNGINWFSYDGDVPKVSIILPTYNRAHFLAQAFESIRAQTMGDWELIVVDDGSTDGTRGLVAERLRGICKPTRYVYQENRGPYGARNTGLDHARGEYIAFFDSDDYWFPHHLDRCVQALEAHLEVDWVHGAGRIVDLETGKVLLPNTHYSQGRPRPFLKLRTRVDGQLRIIEQPNVLKFALAGGFSCGLQKSVIRRSVFKSRRFCTDYHNEAEDRLFLVRALAAGHRLAYYDQIHVEYRVHAANSTAPGRDTPFEKKLHLVRTLIRGYEDLFGELALTPSERQALNKRLGQENFWKLGYALLWNHGRRADALDVFRSSLRRWPWSLKCWKTFLLATLRTHLRLL